MKINKYVERLFNEWRTHSKIIIAVDYDSTLFPWHTIDNQEDIDAVISLVKECVSVGAYVVIFSASKKERHDEIRKYCESIDLPIDSINENPVELPYGHEGKIYYNINLCDRSGLLEACETLRTAMYLQRAHKAGKRLDYKGSAGF